MKKFKFLNSLLVSSALLGSVSVVASCAKDSTTALAKEIVEKAYYEFLDIARVPRPSGHTHDIRNYIMTWAEKHGYKPHNDLNGRFDTQEKSLPVNIWFDVDATPGYENYKKIMIQGHMDMVVAGLEGKAAYSQGIEVQYHPEDHSITSRDKKTSLGADDGIGLGTIFALLQNKKVKHGPLRILITADEETGMEGAKALPDKVLTPCDYYLNLDGELDREGYYRSCQGASQYDYDYSFTDSDTETVTSGTMFDLYIDGFQGGHSGNDINKMRLSATVFLIKLLDNLNDDNLKIVEYNHTHENEKHEIIDDKPSSTAIPKLGRVRIITTKTNTDINNALTKTKNDFKSKFTGENWNGVKLDLSIISFDQIKCLTPATTKKIITLVSNKNKAGFEWGMLKQDGDRPTLSCNIAPLTITNKAGKMGLTLSTNSRGVKTKDMQNMLIDWDKKWDAQFSSASRKQRYAIDPWEANEKDKLQKLANQGYKNINIDPYIRDTNGCVEPAPIFKKKQFEGITCLGTKFKDVHTTNETCWLDPLVNTVKVMFYIFENAK